MKTKKILLVLAFFSATLPAMAQFEDYKNPDESNYVIFGNMHNEFQGDRQVFWLDEVSHKGITFKDEGRYTGEFDGVQKVAFNFKNANTTHPNGFRDGFILWKRTKDVNGKYYWKPETEKNESRNVFEKKKVMSVMLVLDCSGSMSDDGCQNFDKMKRSAVSFLETLFNASSEGNIHVGIVAFNNKNYADDHTIAPEPLNYGNYEQMRKYIQNLPKAPKSNTALYYSVDKAVELLQDDYSKNASSFSFGAIAAFSDGDDNNSTSAKKRIPTSEDYMDYLNKNFASYKVGAYNILNTTKVIGLRGWENGKPMNDRSWKTMQGNLIQAFGNEAFWPLEDIDELSSKFAKFAESLIERNTTLICEVPSGYKNEIAWTLKERKNYKPEPEPSNGKRSPWWGFGFEGGGFFGEYGGGFWGMNIDMAFSINKTFAVGGRLGMFCSYYESYYSYSYDYYYGGYNYYNNYSDGFAFSFLMGPELKITFPKNNAILVSVGGGLMADYESFGYLMVGYKTKKSFYFMAESLFSAVGAGFGAGFGFSFGGKLR